MSINLIPSEPKDTGNYFCTWDSQCDHMNTLKDRPKDRSSRDAMNEDFLFGKDGVLVSFEGVRGDLTVVLDDGWDVPYGATDTRVFGSLDADGERFPSLRALTPAGKLKALSERIKALGYRGLGLWVPTQSRSLADGREIRRTPDEERLYWEERAKWCAEGGVIYIKADWGSHQGDADYCAMMTGCMRKYAPDLAVEHGFSGYPLLGNEDGALTGEKETYLKKVFPVSDFLRTYDVVHELKYASTVNRAAICLEAARACRAETVLNIEDTALIGAALGCSVGVMRHELEQRRKYLPLPPRPVSESVAALRWQRIAPPFAAGRTDVAVSTERLKDIWRCPERAPGLWPNVPAGDYCVTAPSAVARNMPLPEVAAKGEIPYVLCSVHPDCGALCVAVTPRTLTGGIDLTLPADIKVRGAKSDAPVGLFGRFSSLTVDFGECIEGARVYAQSMLSDTAEDVTDRVELSGGRLTVPGGLMTAVDAGADAENRIPAVVLLIASGD